MLNDCFMNIFKPQVFNHFTNEIYEQILIIDEDL